MSGEVEIEMTITSAFVHKVPVRALIAGLFMACAMTTPALAGQREDADAAYIRGDYTTAAAILYLLADQGNADAQFALGTMYSNGRGVPQDYAEAVKWYRKAADQGTVGAQFNLGLMYSAGQGVPQDDAEAVKWYRKAADQGNANAQFGLGLMYGDGWGVPQDYAEAVKWYRKAADQGSGWAQNNLGTMYSAGQGVPQDYVQAHIWFNLAASRSPASEKDGRDRAVKNRDTIAAKMTPTQVAEAQKLAREWKPTLGSQ